MIKRTRRSDGNPFWGCSSFPKCKSVIPYNNEDLEFEVEAPEKEFTPSAYQEKIFDWVRNGKGNAFVEAVAGSGKTTTILECLKFVSGDTIFLAFNKHIAKELARKAPPFVRVATIHSVGFQGINDKFEHKPIVDDKKVLNIISEELGHLSLPLKTYQAVKDFLRRIVPLVKATLSPPSNKKKMMGLCDKYNIESNGHFETCFPFIAKVIKKCKEIDTVIDFDDMIWFPVKKMIPLKKYDWIFVDEAQDLNACQMKMIMKLKKKTTRIVCVGDRFQSIYGFRGADTQAVPKLIEALKAECLPLSICYRCPKTHVAQAKTIVPQIEWWEDQEDGEILNTSIEKAIQEMATGDMVMCRINAPLVPLAFKLIRMDKKVVIRGRDIGKGLITLIDKMDGIDIPDLINKVNQYQFNECRKLAKQENKDMQMQSLEDKCLTLVALTDGINTITELKSRIENIFSDDVQGIVLSSVHRAKGLETDNTYILLPELMPFPKACTPEDIQQELNLKYVAFTRARKKLTFLKE